MNGFSKAIVALFCPLLVILGLGCRPNNLTVPSSPRKTIELEITEVDFGEVHAGETVRHELSVRNISPQTIHLDAVRGSCSCVSGTISQKELPPNGSTAVEIVFAVPETQGEVNYSLFLASSDPRLTPEALPIRAMVFSDIVVSPKRLYVPDSIPGTTEERIVTVEFRNEALKIQSLTTTAEFITVRKLRREDDVAFLSVLVELPQPGMRYNEALNLTSNSRFEPMIVVPIYGYSRSMFVASPTRLSFGIVDLGEDTQRRFSIRHREDRPFEVVAFETMKGSEVSLEPEDGFCEEISVVLRLASSIPEGRLEGFLRLVLRTQQGESETRTVKIEGFVQNAAL